MSDQFLLLVREVERLITAPYAPSLQDLHDLVQRSPSTLIHLWVSRKPCQVGALVDVIVDGLSRSRFALYLLGAFSSLKAVRNAIFERYPALLDQFLQKSIEDDDAECFTACTAMLSTPLPSDFITPSRLAAFIMKLIGRMGESPCAEIIRPLYKVMTGLRTSPRILLEVPSDTMFSLQAELTKTLRNLNDHMGNLLCLATFARIASSQITDAEKVYGAELPSWLQNVKHFFGQKRGLKTLDLVVLRVILACSNSCNSLTADEAAESIRLAIEICDNVEPEQKENWIATNSPKIAKLCEKVTRNGIDYGVQMMGVTFLISLLPATVLSPGIPGLALQGLLSKESRSLLEVVPLNLIPRLVEANAICSGKPSIGSLLSYAFSALKTGSSADCTETHSIQVAKSILLGLKNLDLQFFNSTVAKLTVIQGRETLSELIETFPRQPRHSQCHGSITCYASGSEFENELLFDLFAFYSHALLSLNEDNETPRQIETCTFNAFVTMAKNSMSKIKCSFSETKPFDFRQTFSLLDTHEQSPNSRRDWKAGLAETLMLNSRMSHENIMRKVEEACYDLERRSNNTEAPIRAVEEERDRISLEAEQLQRENDELELRIQQASTTIAELQQNMSRLESHAESATIRVEELLTNLDAVRRELENQRRNSQETVNSEREMARTRELDLLATITEKDDQIEELQEKIREQREQKVAVRKALDIALEEKAATLEFTASLRQEGSKFEESLEQSRLLLAQKDEEINRLLADKEQISLEAEALQTKLDEKTSQADSLQATLQKAEESLRMEIDTLRKEYELQISKITMECAETKEESKSVQAAMHEAASNAAKELQTKDKRIQHLEKKVQHLRDERAAKAREFSEAQQHIGRLMSVVGFKPNPAQSKVPSKQQRPRPTPAPSQIATMLQQTQLEEEDTESQPENIPAESLESNAPHPGGRSPKRSRNVAADQESKELACRTRARPRRERQTFGDIDQNSQPGSQQSSASHSSQHGTFQESRYCPNLNENRLQEIDLDMDLEFSKDFLFTSTSLSERND